MILFTILLIILIIALLAVVLSTGVVGLTILIVFGDVIVFIIIIGWIIKKLFSRKKGK